jgi:hypothetical protein
MRIMISASFIFLLGAASAAPAQTTQTASAPPDIIVTKKEWRLDVRTPSLEEDPFSANAEFNDALRAQRISDRNNTIRARGSESREAPSPRRSGVEATPQQPVVTYVYRAKIKNTGPRTILGVEWAYVFTDPNAQRELGRHRYSSKVKIRPGRDGEIIGRSSTPQVLTVDAKSAGRESHEQIVIHRVEYDDGSFWQSPSQKQPQ